jgi:L,D-transpeptidase YbiS
MTERTIRIQLASQRLDLYQDGASIRSYPVSTAANGAGERNESECTPRGLHRIHAMIGAGCPEGAVFVSRQPTGERCTPALFAAEPDRDWILSRILWLEGCEPGRNRDGDVDTLRRYIYIHGCPDQTEVGRPGSHGCVRMRNRDVLELFELVAVGTRVDIDDAEGPAERHRG